LLLIQRKTLKTDEYREKTQKKNVISDTLSEEEKEKYFWENLDLPSPLYGSDIKGSLFEDNEAGEWNFNKLDTCLSDGLGPISMEGINTPYLYFGSSRSIFAWHVEDYNMGSINFQHYGKPKFWYGISRKVNPIYKSNIIY
jgi:jumonji domain-containing protein 2